MMRADPTWVRMWDERFREEGFAYGIQPSRYLEENRVLLKPGMIALAAADGGGRNAVWLAEQGLDVTLVDLSAEGLARARELAESRKTTIHAIHADLLEWAWPREAYDLIVAIYFHLPPAARQRVHSQMTIALKTAGYLILEGFHVNQIQYRSGGPRDPALLFDEAILRDDFRSLAIEELRVERVELNESRLHSGLAALIRMRARKS